MRAKHRPGDRAHRSASKHTPGPSGSPRFSARGRKISKEREGEPREAQGRGRRLTRQKDGRVNSQDIDRESRQKRNEVLSPMFLDA